MNILMTGGTGLIGSAFISYCKQHRPDWSFTVLTRQSRPKQNSVKYINRLQEIEPASNFDAVINLAGAPVAQSRWSEKRKRVLFDSRIKLTQELIQHLQHNGIAVDTWINASAVGWYGDQGGCEVTEETPAHDEFTHQLCDAWEQAALEAKICSERVCIARLGLVISSRGGFLKQLLLPFKMGLGGPLGNGSQYMPWIHVDDVIGILAYLLDKKDCDGVYNVTAPNPVTNKEFSLALGSVLRRPVFCRVPSWVLKSLLGEMSRLLLTGQNAIPQKLLQSGFKFKYSQVQEALQHTATK